MTQNKVIESVIEQPPIRAGMQKGMKRIHAGSARSKERLRELGFDPIGELVETYEQILELIQYEYDLRDGIVVRLTKAGAERVWYPDMLDKLMDKKLRVAEQLLRYGYGRVPETVNVMEKKPMPLIINTTKKGEVYHAGSANYMDDDENQDDYS
jgi:hypothetical protein